MNGLICIIFEIIYTKLPWFLDNNNQASKILKKIGLPAIIRPAFTLGGLGGGIAKIQKPPGNPFRFHLFVRF